MASPQVQINDGVYAVTFDGTDGALMADPTPFYPQTPTSRKTSSNAPGIDGSENVTVDYENIAESFSANLFGTTTAIRAVMQRLNRLFDIARQYQAPGVRPVYVKFRPDSSESWYRSQILNGRALWAQTTLDWGWPNAATGGMTIQVLLERRFYWENDTEAELRLMAHGDSYPGATGGKTITNHEDGSHWNWVRIANGEVLGDVPSAVRFEMVNASGGTLGKLFVSQEVELNSDNFQAAYEGESATPLSNQTDANSSNGNFNRLTWSGAAETDIATWTISAAENARIRGRWLRVLARFANTFAYTDLYLRLKLLSGAVTIYQTEKQLMAASNSLQEIGSLPIPPRLGDNAVGALSLVLQATRVAGGSCTVDLDYLMLLCLSGWRKFSALGAGVAVSSTVVDDGMPAGGVYSVTGGAKALDVRADGEPLRLSVDSNFYQRTRILAQRADLTAPIADTLTVKAFYRDRRLAI